MGCLHPRPAIAHQSARRRHRPRGLPRQPPRQSAISSRTLAWLVEAWASKPTAFRGYHGRSPTSRGFAALTWCACGWRCWPALAGESSRIPPAAWPHAVVMALRTLPASPGPNCLYSWAYWTTQAGVLGAEPLSLQLSGCTSTMAGWPDVSRLPGDLSALPGDPRSRSLRSQLPDRPRAAGGRP